MRDGHIPAWSQMQWFGFISLPWLQTVPRVRISNPLILPGFHMGSSEASAFLILLTHTQNSRARGWEPCHWASRAWKEISWRHGTWLNHLRTTPAISSPFGIDKLARHAVILRQFTNLTSISGYFLLPEQFTVGLQTPLTHSRLQSQFSLCRNNTLELWRSIRRATTKWEHITYSREASQMQ